MTRRSGGATGRPGTGRGGGRRRSLLALFLGLPAMLLFGAAPATGLPIGGALVGSDGPTVGTDPADADLSALEAEPTVGGLAIPLRAEQPDWLTDGLVDEVLAADGPTAPPPDAPLPGTIGIRPGSWMVAPYGCTMNFIFANGGDLAIGTAGHCVDGTGQEVVLLTLHPESQNPVLVAIGPVLTHVDDGIGADFALVDIPDHLYGWVSPTLAVVGGPCGTYPGGLDTVGHYGHGLGIGTGGTPRAGVATHWESDAYGWAGAAIFGDSGSPVRVTDLRAAGNLTHLTVNPNWLPSYIAGTTIQEMLRLAGGYDLVNSSICPFGTGGDGSDAGGGGGGNGNGPPDDRGGGPPDERGNRGRTVAPTGTIDAWQFRLGIVP